MEVKLRSIKNSVPVLSKINDMDLGDPNINFEFLLLIDELDDHLSALSKFEEKFKKDNDIETLMKLKEKDEKKFNGEMNRLNEKFSEEMDVVLDRNVEISKIEIPISKLKGIPIKELRFLNKLGILKKD